ncbi:retinal-specific phospholipid-transporting ATPase ABCA4-like [Pectinophora gossypiella]|uniref:retinal-specific phospholipid-transporting ATPase ABCA4-like n=1 Tax=Pectinophora gossypiella TaxID=13191 RepID=UPI00214F2435|nr:retinal-specific phospholipid-transporting ATPase ABCA4-like [Pectinophora gossypiella]
MFNEESKKPVRNKFQKQVNVLVWKSYLQRQRRWKLLLVETALAAVLFLVAVFIAKPVFLTPLEAEPVPPLPFADIISKLHKDTIIGYAPNTEPYKAIMERTAELINIEIISAPTERGLNYLLYSRSKGNKIVNKVIWVLWKPQMGNVYRFTVRSTDLARFFKVMTRKGELDRARNPHLHAGFLSIQLAVSQAVLEFASPTIPEYELSLMSMPVSPLMEEDEVRRAISLILLCFTLALLLPVVETEALVVMETSSRLKRALRIRSVNFSTMYLGWLVYGLLTALPICLLGSIALILIFRWIHLVYALLTLLAYFCVMMMLALIMAMFHNKAKIACIWTTLQTLLQTFLAELMVHHKYDEQHSGITFIVHMCLPPLGLLNGLDEFALLQTGRETTVMSSILYTILSWFILIFVYSQILMLLQRTIGSQRAIGGQVSWKAIVFKKAVDKSKLRPVIHPDGSERKNLQEVDDLTAKAISFRRVSKRIMAVPVLHNVTFDIYRGEFTLVLSERIQEKTICAMEDLLTGLTPPDSGSINVLGVYQTPDRNLMTERHMMGYCDNSSFLINDLTVEEHFTFYIQICMWNESNQAILEYRHIRIKQLLTECELEGLWKVRVANLGTYYRVQLSWAIALLLEPRIVIVPYFREDPEFMAVIKDKIMKFKKHITIIKLSIASMDIEHADRLFVLDTRVLAFGGTPAYMFFKFGREYRLRMTFKSGTGDTAEINQLLLKVKEYGATVRAHFGPLLILRMPTNPSSKVAAFIGEMYEKSVQYGITSMNVSLPDPEEVFRRAIHDSRSTTMFESWEARDRSKWALTKISEPKSWKPKRTFCSNFTHLRIIGWKYFSFYIHFRFFLIITVVSSLVAGVFLGLSLASMLQTLELDAQTKKILHGETLTVESMKMNTTLVLRLDDSDQALSVANSYVMSQTYANGSSVSKMSYIALASTESLTEYLVTRAIDSPQHYVHMYAYGMDVFTRNGTLNVQALYSPLHQDQAAAPRSLARVYMALMRHFTTKPDASVEITNEPLILDLTPFLRETTEPALLIQFLLVLTISHITLVPSNEHGLIRHMQSNAMNFSPARYWFTLAFCDTIHYWLLVVVMAAVSFAILLLAVPRSYFEYGDLFVVPFMLMVYGVGCVPQAYLFSLGPRPALNSMALVIVNIVFGEATIVAKLFYGDMYNYALSFMALSPQYNMAYALVKIRQIFLYNNECILFRSGNLCEGKVLHKCCSKCGVLQECYKRKSYLANIKTEVIATLFTGSLFMGILLLWEYRIIPLVLETLIDKLFVKQKYPAEEEMQGATKEKEDVMDKVKQLQMQKHSKSLTLDTFGEYLLAVNLSRVWNNKYVVRNVHLGVGRGEALAIAGLMRHGRTILCEMLSGYKKRNEGHLWAMSKYRLKYSPVNFCKHMALCNEREPLPTWMTVYDALEMLAILRGVPRKHVNEELFNYINALDLSKHEDLLICRLQPSERKRLKFAAAVIGAPSVLVFDECTAYQNIFVRHAMYHIMYNLRKQGHAVIHLASSVEAHLPVSNRLAILRDGCIFDIDYVDHLLDRYSNKGYTVVVHLKDEVDVHKMFQNTFKNFVINDTTDVLVNLQVLDDDLTWETVFKKMEHLLATNNQVYSYIVCAKPIDYIYNAIISEEKGTKEAGDFISRPWLKKITKQKPKIQPPPEKMQQLLSYSHTYDITKLKELPWSVIFHR